MQKKNVNLTKDASLRSPERGLKFIKHNHYAITIVVAPFAGAWIEILLEMG